ncbi:cell division protein FtsW (lipid II flippase) [Alkalibacillus filiformis]|uniref:Cell division protein FtsW (Lipid II flippase) n=1 Tax=Alkalibacillus filiformis TaxID=200990 RepID=A0ABU0DPQ2_9BACI|nr:hypothetical protein [Alkalibacillus filiformis]MDQ0350345.1 cell division protein FtsW (lipid II flippase) [Alkalibacillus filiformis]
MNFMIPFTIILIMMSVGITVMYSAIKDYRNESTKTFNTFISTFILFVVGLVLFLYGADGFWEVLSY